MGDGNVEVRKSVGVRAAVDVLVAGGGISGCTAALTAARQGARVMIVERFGVLGGNMGPGMFSGGVLHLATGYPHVMTGGLPGIPGEFINRCEGYSDAQLGRNKLRDSQVVAYVWSKLMAENNVQVLLNATVCDPIMDDRRVKGLIVEHSGGTCAIEAKVVIDCTGEADVAWRAGAPTDPNVNASSGMLFAIAGIDGARYAEFHRTEPAPSPADIEWAQAAFKGELYGFVSRLNPFLTRYRMAWELGEYRIVRSIGGGARVSLDHGLATQTHETQGSQNGILEAQIGVLGVSLANGDPLVLSAMESEARAYIFETAQFLRRHVPGCEQSWLLTTSPFFHRRAGRCCITELSLKREDILSEKRFDDVVFRVYVSHEPPGMGTGTGGDFPYRQLIPRNVDGLLAAGRSCLLASAGMRTRWKVFLMGQAAGVAAALAARDGVGPRQVNVRELQGILRHRHHAPMGEDSRLKELGIE